MGYHSLTRRQMVFRFEKTKFAVIPLEGRLERKRSSELQEKERELQQSDVCIRRRAISRRRSNEGEASTKTKKNIQNPKVLLKEES